MALSTISEVKNLIETYQKLYNKSQDDKLQTWQKELANWIFTWLLGQQCEMKASEILTAIRPRLNYIEVSPETAVLCCQYLIIYDETKNRFEFRHFSVVEFFKNKESSGYFGVDKIHERLAETCMQLHRDLAQFHLGLYDDFNGAMEQYIKKVRQWEMPKAGYKQWESIPRTRESFLPYAHEFWAYHCGQSGHSNDQKWREFFQCQYWITYHSDSRGLLLGPLSVFDSSEFSTSLMHRLLTSYATRPGSSNISFNPFMFFVGCKFKVSMLP